MVYVAYNTEPYSLHPLFFGDLASCVKVVYVDLFTCILCNTKMPFEVFVSFTLENLCVWTVRIQDIYTFFFKFLFTYNSGVVLVLCIHTQSIHNCLKSVSRIALYLYYTYIQQEINWSFFFWYKFRIKICLNFKNELWRDERCQKVVILNKIVKH